jgi:type II secretory ATPase GspE/PulE/Tfp pilus assembly ATPase PilB-like protein
VKEGGQAAHVYRLRTQETKLKEGITQDPIVSLVDALLCQAIAYRASDIHLEPTHKHLRVRYRIDGVLYDQPSIERGQQSLVISRLKVLSCLDIAERRVPQDGKFRAAYDMTGIFDSDLQEKFSTKMIDLRIATFPCLHGEKMVIRLLNRSGQHITLEDLGFHSTIFASVSSMINKPHGLFLVTGPTGSGKTTTLYALLDKLNTSERNIVTMEDPIEYNIDGITQSQVNLKACFSFENGLRSLVRQDPDIVMIGEIRDLPTVQIAIEAGLTGHLVLSTLHTNDAAGAITRLIDMGIEPFLIGASLVGVLAQRLVRTICIQCKEERVLSSQELQRAQNHGWDVTSVWTGVGCHHCLQTGYHGRTGVFELLMMTNELRDLIMTKTSTSQLHVRAIQEGMKVLSLDALDKLKQGKISFKEFLRVAAE